MNWNNNIKKCLSHAGKTSSFVSFFVLMMFLCWSLNTVVTSRPELDQDWLNRGYDALKG